MIIPSLLLAAATALPAIPDLEGFEPVVATRIESTHAELVAVFDDPTSSADERAAALGHLGRLYHAHEIEDPAGTCYLAAAELQPGNATWPHLAGDIASRTGRDEAARSLFGAAITIDPEDHAARFRLAKLKLEEGELEEARTLLDTVVSAEPTWAAGHAELGRLSLLEGDFEEAVDHLETALSMVPQANALYHPLARALIASGRIEDGRALLEQAGSVGIRIPDPLIDDLIDLAVGARIRVQRARRARAAGRLEDALIELQLAVENDPRNVTALVDFGVNLAEFGHDDLAIESFSAALEVDPTNADAAYDLAMLLLRGDLVDEAAVLLRRVVAKRPEDLEARRKLVAVLLSQGQLALASAHLSTLAKASPEDSEISTAQARIALALDAPEVAIAVLEEAISHRASRDTVSFLALIYALAAEPMGNTERALMLSESLFSEGQVSAEETEIRIVALAAAGRCEQARVVLRKLQEATTEADRALSSRAQQLVEDFGASGCELSLSLGSS